MHVDLLARKYPPLVYGRVDVRVLELARVLRSRIKGLRVQTLDGPREPGTEDAGPGVTGHTPLVEFEGTNVALGTLDVGLSIATARESTDLVHSYTQYASFAGHLASPLHGAPHVISVHSLESLRPWKAERLGDGHRISSYVEKTAYGVTAAIVAVSNGVRDDVSRCYLKVDPAKVRVIHDNIDLMKWKALEGGEGRKLKVRILAEHDTDLSRRTVAFVGRVIHQRSLSHFPRAVHPLPEGIQIILYAGAPDTPEIAAEVGGLVNELKETRSGVVLVSEMPLQPEVVAVLDSVNVFITPSVYEPLGVVNLEAIALGLPVVDTATGGIPDVIADRQTGYLIPVERMTDGTGTPLGPKRFEYDMVERSITVLDNETPAKHMGEAGLARARDSFSQDTISAKTVTLYSELV